MSVCECDLASEWINESGAVAVQYAVARTVTKESRERNVVTLWENIHKQAESNMYIYHCHCPACVIMYACMYVVQNGVKRLYSYSNILLFT